jgi:hypothetical protein
MRNGLADHAWQILRGRNRQVNESDGVDCGAKDSWRNIAIILIDPQNGDLQRGS